jgi:hypothetical protein
MTPERLAEIEATYSNLGRSVTLPDAVLRELCAALRSQTVRAEKWKSYLKDHERVGKENHTLRRCLALAEAVCEAHGEWLAQTTIEGYNDLVIKRSDAYEAWRKSKETK